MSQIIIKPFGSLITEACAATLRHNPKRMLDPKVMYATEHSPIRTDRYWVQLIGIPTFVSVHLVRHKKGVEHFVMTARDDLGGTGNEDRNTPVNHAMDINAQALINLARKRLCLKSHPKTIGVMTRIRKAMFQVNPALASCLSAECVYRNGLCPERKMCKAGVDRVCAAYPAWPGHRRIG